MPHTFVHNRVLFLLALFKPFFVALDQALAQCENTLTKLGLVREAVDDTAGAAKQIAFENLNDAAAVASEKAAKIYGLNIVAKDIQVLKTFRMPFPIFHPYFYTSAGLFDCEVQSI
jgi:hypothetical protein